MSEKILGVNPASAINTQPLPSTLVKSSSSPSLLSGKSLTTLQRNLALADDILSRALNRASYVSSPRVCPHPPSLKSICLDDDPKLNVFEDREKDDSNVEFASDSVAPQSSTKSIEIPKETKAKKRSFPHTPKRKSFKQSTFSKVQLTRPLKPRFSSTASITVPSHAATPTKSSAIPNPIAQMAVSNDLPVKGHEPMTFSEASLDVDSEKKQNENEASEVSGGQITAPELADSSRSLNASSSKANDYSKALCTLSSPDAGEEELKAEEKKIEKHLDVLQSLHDRIVKMNKEFIEQHNGMLYQSSAVVKKQTEEHMKFFQHMLDRQASWQIAQAQQLSQSTTVIQPSYHLHTPLRTSLPLATAFPTSSSNGHPSRLLTFNHHSDVAPPMLVQTTTGTSANFPLASLPISHSDEVLPNASGPTGFKDPELLSEDLSNAYFKMKPPALQKHRSQGSSTDPPQAEDNKREVNLNANVVVPNNSSIPKPTVPSFSKNNLSNLEHKTQSAFVSERPEELLKPSAEIQQIRAKLQEIANAPSGSHPLSRSLSRNAAIKRVEEALGGHFDYTSAYRLVNKLNQKLSTTQSFLPSHFSSQIMSHLKSQPDQPSVLASQSRASPIKIQYPSPPTRFSRSPTKRANIPLPPSLARSPPSASAASTAFSPPRPTSPLRTPNPFYQVRLSQNPIFLRRTSIKPPFIPTPVPPKPPPYIPTPFSTITKKHLSTVARKANFSTLSHIFNIEPSASNPKASRAIQKDMPLHSSLPSSESSSQSFIPIHISRIPNQYTSTQSQSNPKTVSASAVQTKADGVPTGMDSAHLLPASQKLNQPFLKSSAMCVQTGSSFSNQTPSLEQADILAPLSTSKLEIEKSVIQNTTTTQTDLLSSINKPALRSIEMQTAGNRQKKNFAQTKSTQLNISEFETQVETPDRNTSETKTLIRKADSTETATISVCQSTSSMQTEAPLFSHVASIVQTEFFHSNTVQTEAPHVPRVSSNVQTEFLNSNTSQTDCMQENAVSSSVQTDALQHFSTLSQSENIFQNLRIAGIQVELPLYPSSRTQKDLPNKQLSASMQTDMLQQATSMVQTEFTPAISNLTQPPFEKSIDSVSQAESLTAQILSSFVQTDITKQLSGLSQTKAPFPKSSSMQTEVTKLLSTLVQTETNAPPAHGMNTSQKEPEKSSFATSLVQTEFQPSQTSSSQTDSFAPQHVLSSQVQTDATRLSTSLAQTERRISKQVSSLTQTETNTEIPSGAQAINQSPSMKPDISAIQTFKSLPPSFVSRTESDNKPIGQKASSSLSNFSAMIQTETNRSLSASIQTESMPSSPKESVFSQTEFSKQYSQGAPKEDDSLKPKTREVQFYAAVGKESVVQARMGDPEFASSGQLSMYQQGLVGKQSKASLLTLEEQLYQVANSNSETQTISPVHASSPAQTELQHAPNFHRDVNKACKNVQFDAEMKEMHGISSLTSTSKLTLSSSSVQTEARNFISTQVQFDLNSPSLSTSIKTGTASLAQTSQKELSNLTTSSEGVTRASAKSSKFQDVDILSHRPSASLTHSAQPVPSLIQTNPIEHTSTLSQTNELNICPANIPITAEIAANPSLLIQTDEAPQSASVVQAGVYHFSLANQTELPEILPGSQGKTAIPHSKSPRSEIDTNSSLGTQKRELEYTFKDPQFIPLLSISKGVQSTRPERHSILIQKKSLKNPSFGIQTNLIKCPSSGVQTGEIEHSSKLIQSDAPSNSNSGVQTKSEECISTSVQSEFIKKISLGVQAEGKEHFSKSIQSGAPLNSSSGVQTKPQEYTSTSVQSKVIMKPSSGVQADGREKLSTSIQLDPPNISSLGIQAKPQEHFSSSVQSETPSYLSLGVQTSEKVQYSTSIQLDPPNISSLGIQTKSQEHFSSSMQSETPLYPSLGVQTSEKLKYSTSIQLDPPNISSLGIQTKPQEYFSSSVQAETPLYTSLGVQTIRKENLSKSIESDAPTNPSLGVETKPRDFCSTSVQDFQAPETLENSSLCVQAKMSNNYSNIVQSGAHSNLSLGIQAIETDTLSSLTQDRVECLGNDVIASTAQTEATSLASIAVQTKSTMKKSMETQSAPLLRNASIVQTDLSRGTSTLTQTDASQYSKKTFASAQTESPKKHSLGVQAKPTPAKSIAVQSRGAKKTSTKMQSILQSNKAISVQTDAKQGSLTFSQTDPIEFGKTSSTSVQTVRPKKDSLGVESKKRTKSSRTQTRLSAPKSLSVQTLAQPLSSVLTQTEKETTSSPLNISMQSDPKSGLFNSRQSRGTEITSANIRTQLPVQFSSPVQTDIRGEESIMTQTAALQKDTSSIFAQTELHEQSSTAIQTEKDTPSTLSTIVQTDILKTKSLSIQTNVLVDNSSLIESPPLKNSSLILNAEKTNHSPLKEEVQLEPNFSIPKSKTLITRVVTSTLQTDQDNTVSLPIQTELSMDQTVKPHKSSLSSQTIFDELPSSATQTTSVFKVFSQMQTEELPLSILSSATQTNLSKKSSTLSQTEWHGVGHNEKSIVLQTEHFTTFNKTHKDSTPSPYLPSEKQMQPLSNKAQTEIEKTSTTTEQTGILEGASTNARIDAPQQLFESEVNIPYFAVSKYDGRDKKPSFHLDSKDPMQNSLSQVVQHPTSSNLHRTTTLNFQPHSSVDPPELQLSASTTLTSEVHSSEKLKTMNHSSNLTQALTEGTISSASAKIEEDQVVLTFSAENPDSKDIFYINNPVRLEILPISTETEIRQSAATGTETDQGQHASSPAQTVTNLLADSEHANPAETQACRLSISHKNEDRSRTTDILTLNPRMEFGSSQTDASALHPVTFAYDSHSGTMVRSDSPTSYVRNERSGLVSSVTQTSTRLISSADSQTASVSRFTAFTQTGDVSHQNLKSEPQSDNPIPSISLAQEKMARTMFLSHEIRGSQQHSTSMQTEPSSQAAAMLQSDYPSYPRSIVQTKSIPTFSAITQTRDSLLCANPIAFVQTESTPLILSSMQLESHHATTRVADVQTEPPLQSSTVTQTADFPISKPISSTTIQTDMPQYATAVTQTAPTAPTCASFMQTDTLEIPASVNQTSPLAQSTTETQTERHEESPSPPREATCSLSKTTRPTKEILSTVIKPQITVESQTDPLQHTSVLTRNQPLSFLNTVAAQTEDHPFISSLSCVPTVSQATVQMQTDRYQPFSSTTQTEVLNLNSSMVQTEALQQSTTVSCKPVDAYQTNSEVQTIQYPQSSSLTQTMGRLLTCSTVQTNPSLKSSSNTQTNEVALRTLIDQTEEFPHSPSARNFPVAYHSSSYMQTDSPPQSSFASQTTHPVFKSLMVQTDPLAENLSLKPSDKCPLESTTEFQLDQYPQSSTLAQISPQSFISSSVQTETFVDSVPLIRKSALEALGPPIIESSARKPNQTRASSNIISTPVQTDTRYQTIAETQTSVPKGQSSSVQTVSTVQTSADAQTSKTFHNTPEMQTEFFQRSSALAQTVLPTNQTFAIQMEHIPPKSVDSSTAQTEAPSLHSKSAQTVSVVTPHHFTLCTQTGETEKAHSSIQTDAPQSSSSFSQTSKAPVAQISTSFQTEDTRPMHCSTPQSVAQIQVQPFQSHQLSQTEAQVHSQATSTDPMYPTVLSVGTQACAEAPQYVSTETQVALATVDEGVMHWVRHQILARSVTNSLLHACLQQIVHSLALGAVAAAKKVRLIQMGVQTSPPASRATFSMGSQTSAKVYSDFGQSTIPPHVSEQGLQVNILTDMALSVSVDPNQESSGKITTDSTKLVSLVPTSISQTHVVETSELTNSKDLTDKNQQTELRAMQHSFQQTTQPHVMDELQQTELQSAQHFSQQTRFHDNKEQEQQTTPVPEMVDASLQTSQALQKDVSLQLSPISMQFSSQRAVEENMELVALENADLPTELDHEARLPFLNTTLEITPSSILRPSLSMLSIHEDDDEENETHSILKDSISDLSSSSSLTSSVSFSEGELLPFSKSIRKKIILGQLHSKTLKKRSKSPGEVSSCSFQLSNSTTLSLLS